MGNQTASKNTTVRKRFLTLSFVSMLVVAVSVGAVFLQPSTAVHALDTNTPTGEQPTSPMFVFVNQPAAKTNNTSLAWQWAFTPAPDDTTVYTGFHYVVTTADGATVDQASGDQSLTSYTKSDAQSGVTYTLTVTATVAPDTTPAVTPSVITSTVEVNVVPPVVTDNGTAWSGNTATPGLEVNPGQQPTLPITPTDPATEPTTPEEPTAPTVPTEPSVANPDPTSDPTPTPEPTPPTYTYSWTTDAGSQLVTISDTAVLNPAITFKADGKASFWVHITDEFGNFIEYLLQLSYVKPFIPGPTVPLLPEYTPPELPPVAPVVKVPALSRNVPIDTAAASRQQNNESIDSAAETSKHETPDLDAHSKATIIAATTNQGWLLFGVPWYWWLLGITIIGSAIIWFRSGVHRHRADDI